MKTNYKPEGFHTVTPYIVVNGGVKALEFYKNAFGAKEREKHLTEDDKLMHATFAIGDSLIMISDEFPESECNMAAPQNFKGSPVMLHLYVEDVDSFFNRAVKAGAKVIRPVEDMFWGDRYGQLEDPFGHLWSIATFKEQMTPEQVTKGAECCMGKKSCSK